MLLVVLAVSFLFGLVVLPRLDPGVSDLEGRPAPDFSLPVTHGGDPGSRIRLSNLRGGVVVLDFWASWCRPCLEQIPLLGRAAKDLAGRATFVGVATGDDPDSAQSLLRKLNPPYASVDDADGTVAEAYRVDSLPTLVVIDPEGAVRAARKGVIDLEELEKLVAEAGSRSK